MSAGIVTLLILGLIVVCLVLGLPIAFALGGTAVAFTYFLQGTEALGIVASRAWGQMTSFVTVCIPLFIFMGMMLERSGIAHDLYTMMYRWAGALRGALAAGTVMICMGFAAMTGLSATATVTMGGVALPEMFKRGYNKGLALGCIGAGGALGILIPPSVTMVLYAMIAQESIGKLFAGGIIPGILLGFLFIGYILIRSAIQKDVAPPLSPQDRGTWHDKAVSLRAVVLPMLIILAVLGSIFTGIATPTEASAIGALSTIICAAIHRRLTWQNLKDSCYQTLRITAMAMWIYLGSLCFTTLYYTIGATDFIRGILLGVPGGAWGTIISIQFIWFIMGMLLDPWGIIMITGPIFCLIVADLGFSLVWFGILFIVNMEMAYITPPFGFNLFYLKGVAPQGVSMGQIYRGAWPFILCQAFGLVTLMVFPQLALALPSLMVK